MIQVEQNKFALQFFSFLNKKNSRAVLFPGCEEGVAFTHTIESLFLPVPQAMVRKLFDVRAA
jgi:hypothetical protein